MSVAAFVDDILITQKYYDRGIFFFNNMSSVHRERMDARRYHYLVDQQRICDET
jgi:hypothetical protein